ncbi:hypothetical protein B0H10DRAFT_1994498 [Mycena sp. CBHHK59/15]|nr:hypothetical protein B0H10DRAFT_1994498 [Mycena sp. CBHHK59/15]
MSFSPPDFNRYEAIDEHNWKYDAQRILGELQALVQQQQSSLSLKEQGDIISTTSVFDGDGPWITSDSRSLANDILHNFSDPPQSLVVQILENNVKPLFRSNPHPSLNLETGRKLARPAGGPMASQDFYDSQTWKDYPGSSNIVLWCLRNMPSNAYEGLWHLVIPPIMALLDDYEARYKLLGINLTSVMLERVPSTVLKRTGVDSLLRSSLNRSLAHLGSPETPSLLRGAISTSLSLILLVTTVGSADRFDQLCGLLGDGIIGSIWPYSSDRLDALLASIEALPPVVEILGVGCARYLKVLIAQLVHPLAPTEYEKTSVALQTSSLRALAAVIDACSERMSHWKGTILNGVARCWVTNLDSSPDSFPEGLKQELRHVCFRLAAACPSVRQEEYPRFVAADPAIFEELLGVAK